MPISPYTYQDRLDRQRELNNKQHRKVCCIPGCNRLMVGIIEINPYCKLHHEQYFINLNKQRKKMELR